MASVVVSSDFILLLVLVVRMMFESRAVPSVVEVVSIAGSMSDSMEESGDGAMMVAVCATFGRRRMMERRHNDVDVTSGAILLRLLSVFLIC